ncbi:MAG: ATP cone domain-containing protein [bacterium]|nr:ATP cone domain-containing protein [bacterium]
MATTVIKRDGSKQGFDEGKLTRSIEAACADAGLEAEKTAEVVSKVAPVVLQAAADKEEIATSELKQMILAELDKTEPAASAAWRAHDEKKGVN